eukprot:gene137-159_t
MGPFRLMDLIGVDTNFSVTSSMYQLFHYDPKFRPSRIQQQKVDAGHHGLAKPIDEATAKQVGQNFLATRTTTAAFKTGLQLELAVTENSKAYNAQSSSAPIAYYYIFNVANGDGFVIVSADDKAIPVLGYSDAVDFNPTNIAPQTAKWLEGYKAEIRSIIQSNATQSAEV